VSEAAAVGSTKGADLVALSLALPERHSALAKKIIGLRDSHSCRSDLVLAQDMIGSFIDMGDALANADVGSIAQNSGLALIYTAVVLYARATKSGSNTRNTAQLGPYFTDDEKRAHRLICDLRDDAIAHFGAGKNYNGPKLREDGVFILPNDAGAPKVASISRTLVGDRQLVVALQRQITAAVIHIDRVTQERNADVVGMLNKAVDEDPEFLAIVQSCEGSLAAFLKSEAAATDVLSGPRIGSRRGSYNHK
jgi:hypothetical protein